MPRPAYGGRPTCELFEAIDAREWHREGLLRSGCFFTQSRDKRSGSIAVETEADAVVLNYGVGSGRNWKAVEQRVPIARTACGFGGERPWFGCPSCGRRVAVLYKAGDTFACRHCNGLVFRSQQLSPRYRNLDVAQKIRLKLGGSPDVFDGFPEKPKGMHQRTYLRLRTRAQKAESVCLNSFR